MALSISPGQSDILTVLRSFLISILPATNEVVLAQDNRVPEPRTGDFVVMTPIRFERLRTNLDTWDPSDPGAVAITMEQGSKVTFQLDVHGPKSADNAQIISTAFRDDFAVQAFAAITDAVIPLYADDPRQMPFVNENDQVENRWTIEAVMQANQIVSVPQQFANALVVGLIEVDASFPPGP